MQAAWGVHGHRHVHALSEVPRLTPPTHVHGQHAYACAHLFKALVDLVARLACVKGGAVYLIQVDDVAVLGAVPLLSHTRRPLTGSACARELVCPYAYVHACVRVPVRHAGPFASCTVRARMLKDAFPSTSNVLYLRVR